ncbi:MAG: ATP-binding cassette domain-containing protein [Planctomycetes bacterium]|nr:ATP-binding cassette domain-containing protein [Planctomycetota bacterium]
MSAAEDDRTRGQTPLRTFDSEQLRAGEPQRGLTPSPAVAIEGLGHRYGGRRALEDISFEVARGEIFGLVGPNGGGKTTLFRLLSTLLPVQEGRASVFGRELANEPDAVRRAIGVTFQSPSLDGKLTVRENLRHQGHLYGLSGLALRDRITRLLDRLALSDRGGDRADSLSGGLKRQVEIAKGLLHDPQLLLLDEPSTGLDPGARLDLWKLLESLKRDSGVTVLATTHLMDEAERADRLAILDRGKLVAIGTPEELKDSVGGDCLTIRCRGGANPQVLAGRIAEHFGVTPQLVDGTLRIERDRGHELLREIVEMFPEPIASVSLGRPTLEDVFVARTGRRFVAREDGGDGREDGG